LVRCSDRSIVVFVSSGPVIIGLDTGGNFTAKPVSEGFESSAVGVAVVPARACGEIAAWTAAQPTPPGKEPLAELHANEMNWDQRIAACEMLGARDDVHAAVVVTSNQLLGSPEVVANHRQNQLANADAGLARARKRREEAGETDESPGEIRGGIVRDLLAGRRVSGTLTDPEYIQSAMVPPALVGAIQRAFCFHASDEWRPEMGELALEMDEDTPASQRYVTESLLPTITDERFRLVTPLHWREDPLHPLYARARHPDGDGYRPQELVGETIDWRRSHDSVPVQVADMAAWIVNRAIARPRERVARDCLELLRPMLAGEGGRCFELYSLIEAQPESEAFYAHLPAGEQPAEWLERLAA
jgi:hypothetical protein